MTDTTAHTEPVPTPEPPVPQPDDVTTAWWDATREHRLTVQQCSACQAVQHPPRAVCVACSTLEGLTQVDVSGRGEVDSFTVVHRAPRADVATPYTIARVRLAEGPILLTRIHPHQTVSIGDAVEVTWWDLTDGRALPVFRPTTSSTTT
ncbi:Zn-ribbon domain-containing OB-fold protein [Aeromicrobium sp. Leaf350]|uniref:Zn-ribbon domain-containing OB-fold protein n=1 Tax=Aeromicrobium sp. Leaf350 TaxID=2876565 RepID=UPI001E60A92A|nr:Zn-ribbon domain-containing OB-fold protein [Aeromicrobium sp. Leaf350]